MALALSPDLPELVTVPCFDCKGAGYHESFSSLGVDHSTRCTTCFGARRVEVCSVCKTVPTIRDGVDTCGCTFFAVGGRAWGKAGVLEGAA